LNKTESTGILTKSLKKYLIQKKMPANEKWNWLEPNKGYLSKKIHELPEDFRYIVNSPYTWELIENSKIRDSLRKVIGILSEIIGGSLPIPIWRIVAEKNNGKRQFTVKELKSFLLEKKIFSTFFSDSETKELTQSKNHFTDLRTEYILDKIRKGSGLRTNEWKFLKNYYKKNMNIAPFYMPLDPNKNYSWIEVKRELSKKPYRQTSIASKPQTLNQKMSAEIKPEMAIIKEKLKKYGYDINIKLWKPGL